MIIDLNEPLYVIDNRTHAHRVVYIDFIAKYIYTEFNSRFDEEDDSMFINVVQDGVNAKSTKVRRFKFGTHDLNVTTKEINLTDEEGNLTSTIYNS